MPTDLLKFVVLDEEDLEVVSTHLQDAVVKVADVHWRPAEKRLVVALNRFDWEGAQSDRPEYRRRRAALRFERVLSCKCRSVNPAGKDAVLNLLAVEYSETQSPFGRRHTDFFRRRRIAAGRRMPRSRIGRSRPGVDRRRLPGACSSMNRTDRQSRAPDRNPEFAYLDCLKDICGVEKPRKSRWPITLRRH